MTLTPGLQVADEDTTINVEKFVSAEYIKEFLNISYSCTPFGGKMFSAYYPLGVEYDGHTIKLYLWMLVMEYYLDHQDLKRGCGMAKPVVLFVEIREGYRIVGYQDGGLAGDKIKVNFPAAIQKLFFDGGDVAAYNHRSELLQQEISEEAKAYFGL